MNKSTFGPKSTIGFLSLVFLMLSCSSSEEKTPVHFFEDYILVDQYSDNYTNGFLHGSRLKNIIEDQVDTWQQQMLKELDLSLEQMQEIVYKQSGFITAIQKYAPQLLEEINGVADGAQLDRKLILCYNLGEEIYNYQNQVTERCSNLAVQLKDKNVLVYNQDLPFFLHGTNQPIVLRRKTSLVFTLPGMIALSGVSKTVAVSCNSLPMLQMNTKGLPLAFAIRQLLSCNTLEEASEYLLKTPLAIPQNFLLAASAGIIGFEVSENKVASYSMDSLPYLYHTNFPVHSKDFKYESYVAPTCNRYAAIEAFLTDSISKKELDEQTLRLTFGELPLQNEETYLRFTASFPSKQKAKPIIYFINPRKSNTATFLPF